MQVDGKIAQVADVVRKRIRNDIHTSGQKLPSEAKLAAELGVCRATVRSAYDILEKQGIVFRKKGSGTYVSNAVNKALYNGTNEDHKHIGIVLPGLSPFFKQVCEGVIAGVDARGYAHTLLTNESKETERDAFRTLISQGCRGVILSPNRMYGDLFYENYQILERSNVPYVLIGKPPANVFCNAIYYNDVYGSYEATKHLYYQGCGYVAHITSSKCEYESVNERREGFLNAARRFYPQLPCEQMVIDIASGHFQDRFMALLRELNGKLGLLLYDDLMYPDVLRMVTEAGKHIPKQVAIVGYNDLPLCETMEPALTSVAHDRFRIGKESLELLDLSLAKRGGDSVKHMILKTKLAIRDSTVCC